MGGLFILNAASEKNHPVASLGSPSTEGNLLTGDVMIAHVQRIGAPADSGGFHCVVVNGVEVWASDDHLKTFVDVFINGYSIFGADVSPLIEVIVNSVAIRSDV